MAYAKKTWALDDPITDVALNNIETGVGTAHDVLDATGTPASLSATTTNAIGTATAKAKADHTHAILANGTPSTQAFGDAANAGTSANLARADHKHGMPSIGFIRCGTVFTNDYKIGNNLDVSFGFTFPIVPIVVLTFAPDSSSSVHASLHVVSTTTTGVTIRAYDSDHPGVSIPLGINWIAMVNP